MKRNPLRLGRTLLALAATLVVTAGVAHAAVEKSLCVFDPSGANGDVFNMAKDYQAAAVGWGVDFKLKPYTDEKTASEDFKAKQCDAVMMTGIRTRQFHKFIGSIEAMGALPTYKQLKMIIKSLSSKKAGKLMKSGAYENAGVFPGGAVFMFVRDRKITSVSDLAGKRIATLDFDLASKVMVKQVGASMVAADIGTFSGMFNNGTVDAAYAPAFAYKALEMHKGIGSTGGIVQYPLAQVTVQVLIRSADFPEGFAQSAREYAVSQFNAAVAIAKKAEKSIPAKAWIPVGKEDVEKYDEMFVNVRVRLRDKEKVYNKTMLKLLRRIRCKTDAARAECAEKRE